MNGWPKTDNSTDLLIAKGALRRGSLVWAPGLTCRCSLKFQLYASCGLPSSAKRHRRRARLFRCGRLWSVRLRKLPAVEEAKALMIEAMDWSVFRWLFEKRRVRETADRANAALDKLNQAVKARWRSDVKAAYKELAAKAGGTAPRRQGEPASPTIDPQVRFFAKRVKEADDAAHRARVDAQDTFDEAETQLNTDLAREGCQKAIHQWELDEKAIRRADLVPGSTKATS